MASRAKNDIAKVIFGGSDFFEVVLGVIDGFEG